MRGTRGKGGQVSACSLCWRPLVLGRCGWPVVEPAKALLGRLSLLLWSLKGSSGPWHSTPLHHEALGRLTSPATNITD